MAKRPRILVLMATYNGQSDLAGQLDSILNQTGVDVTLRVGDDCSTDNTFRILETYATEHPNVELLYNSETRGVDCVFMDLIYSAPADEYDFFALAEQGDIWHSDRLASSAAHISANTSRAELYYAGVMSIDEQGNKLGNVCLSYAVCAAHTGSLLLVPNWAIGCTMLLNGSLIKLLRQHRIYDFGRSYDAWVHAVALYCGGYVYSDLHHCYVDRKTNSPAVEALLLQELNPGPEVSNQYTKMADALLREYKNDMDSDTAKLVEAVAVRRISAKARHFLYRRKDIMMTTKPRTSQMRWMVLLNRY